MEAAQPEPNLLVPVVTRLADEGIPVLAIARATSIPSSDVYEILNDAVLTGRIISLPNPDWPPDSNRAGRTVTIPGPLDTDDGLQTAVTRFFKTSPLQTAMFMLLMRRDKATKAQLHHVIESARDPQKEPTEIKIVDVMICNLRKKLRPHDINIETLWGSGYYVPKAMKQQAMTLMATLDTL